MLKFIFLKAQSLQMTTTLTKSMLGTSFGSTLSQYSIPNINAAPFVRCITHNFILHFIFYHQIASIYFWSEFVSLPLFQHWTYKKNDYGSDKGKKKKWEFFYFLLIMTRKSFSLNIIEINSLEWFEWNKNKNRNFFELSFCERKVIEDTRKKERGNERIFIHLFFNNGIWSYYMKYKNALFDISL